MNVTKLAMPASSMMSSMIQVMFSPLYAAIAKNDCRMMSLGSLDHVAMLRLNSSSIWFLIATMLRPVERLNGVHLFALTEKTRCQTIGSPVLLL